MRQTLGCSFDEYILMCVVFLLCCSLSHYIVCIPVSFTSLNWNLFYLINIEFPIFLWMTFARGIVLYPFTFNLCLSLDIRFISWRQQGVEFCFLIQEHLLCLIGDFSPLMFGVIIDMWKSVFTVLFPVLWLCSIPCLLLCVHSSLWFKSYSSF